MKVALQPERPSSAAPPRKGAAEGAGALSGVSCSDVLGGVPLTLHRAHIGEYFAGSVSEIARLARIRLTQQTLKR